MNTGEEKMAYFKHIDPDPDDQYPEEEQADLISIL